MRNDDASKIVQSAIGLNIGALRKRYGFSQAGFARMISVDRSYVNQIENGRKNPTVEVLIKIADGLDVPITELFCGLEVAPPRMLPECTAEYSVVKLPR